MQVKLFFLGGEVLTLSIIYTKVFVSDFERNILTVFIMLVMHQ